MIDLIIKKANDKFNWMSLEPVKGVNVTVKQFAAEPIAEKSEYPSAFASKKNLYKIY